MSQLLDFDTIDDFLSFSNGLVVERITLTRWLPGYRPARPGGLDEHIVCGDVKAHIPCDAHTRATWFARTLTPDGVQVVMASPETGIPPASQPDLFLVLTTTILLTYGQLRVREAWASRKSRRSFVSFEQRDPQS